MKVFCIAIGARNVFFKGKYKAFPRSDQFAYLPYTEFLPSPGHRFVKQEPSDEADPEHCTAQPFSCRRATNKSE